jgi:hypothetical protein
MQATFYIFVKDTGNQRLVRNTFSKGFFLQPSKVFRSQPEKENEDTHASAIILENEDTHVSTFQQLSYKSWSNMALLALALPD